MIRYLSGFATLLFTLTVAVFAQDATAVLAAHEKAAEEFTWSYTTLITCTIGYLTHIILVWGEDRKNAPVSTDGKKLSFTAWLSDDWSVPAVGLLGAIVGYILLPSLGKLPLIGPLMGDQTITFSALGAYAVGLAGSYLARKLATLFTPAKPNP